MPQILFVTKPLLAQTKKTFIVPSFKALAVLFPDFHNSGYVKQHNVALPLEVTILVLKRGQQSANNNQYSFTLEVILED